MNNNNKINAANAIFKANKNAEKNQLIKKTSILTNHTNSFRIPALNPTELKTNPIIVNENYSHFEEKPDFQKYLDKLKNNQKNEEKANKFPKPDNSQKKSLSTSPMLKRCLTFKNEKKNFSAKKRKSEASFNESISIQEGNNEKMTINFAKMLPKKASNQKIVPITTNNNFNITITNVNNNFVLPEGHNYKFNLIPRNSSSKEEKDTNNLLSPLNISSKKKEKDTENNWIDSRRSLNILPDTKTKEISSLDIIQRQSSIQPTPNSIIRKPTLKHMKTSSFKKNKEQMEASMKESRLVTEENFNNTNYNHQNVFIFLSLLNLFLL